MNTWHDITKEFEGLKICVKEVSERRVSPARQLKVLSIVGFGGLGKTTLANEIYRKLDGQFDCRAFVSVSQKPDIGKILRTILSKVNFRAPTGSNIEMWGESELISALENFLVHKRYFIVIDDLWDDSPWDIIKCALPKNKNGSRVITTTRIETVARACCTDHIEYVYEMKPLNEEDSRTLFFKRIFGSEDACPSYLKEVSAEILKCGGLPLAINTTSSLLASHKQNNSKEHWEYVRNYIGTKFDVSPSLDGMRQILNLSYINLPHYLKACMLYLGIYLEDHTIQKNDLARQWVAEGFISKGHGIDLEDIAWSYFNELINRSMIQPSKTSCNGEYGAWFSRVPEWVNQLHSLYDLVLHVKEVLEGDVGIIAQVPSLVRVHLNIQRRPKDKIIVLGSGFSVLKSFLVSCSRISYLVFEAGAMPKLGRLHLSFNAMGWDRYGGAAPSGIEYLSSLKEISADIGEYGAEESNIRAAESALRNSACMHPARHKVIIDTFYGDFLFDESDEEDGDDEGSCHSTS
uniref:Uncharacterized protein n=1 Tax=Leersia perrieri TaxID=77586 RepID=A0A0D9X0L1_9ORYZ